MLNRYGWNGIRQIVVEIDFLGQIVIPLEMFKPLLRSQGGQDILLYIRSELEYTQRQLELPGNFECHEHSFLGQK
jgi:hypothetical protein